MERSRAACAAWAAAADRTTVLVGLKVSCRAPAAGYEFAACPFGLDEPAWRNR